MKMKQLVVEALSQLPPPHNTLMDNWLPRPACQNDIQREIAELNSHWHYILWQYGNTTGKSTIEVRRSLIQTSDPDEWIRVFKRDVVPFLEQIQYE